MKNDNESRSEQTLSLDGICARITSSRRPNLVQPRIVGIDGLGGAGKSTLAARLAQCLGKAATVHTDDFASWDNPLDWYPRLISDALEPLSRGQAARFQCFDWEKRAAGPWLSVSPTPVVILEGVSATRRAFARFLAYRIWVDAARDVRLARGLQRDGEAMRGQWEAWMRDEDAYVAEEHPERSADLVIAGDPHVDHDPEREIVVRVVLHRGQVSQASQETIVGEAEKAGIVVVDYDPKWPKRFENERTTIEAALGERALGIEHIGSTAVPGLAAKAIIDISLVVADSSDEATYVPDLEAAGYALRVREPNWHEHRMLRTPGRDVHLHVYSRGSSEINRNLVLRDWLRQCTPDRELYASTKRALAKRDWPTMQDYADAKTEVIEDILSRARPTSV